jgi:amino acid transporter
VLILIFAFFGFEMALVPAGEVKDPRKAFPFALLVTLAAVTIIYIVVQIVSIGTLPDLATSERPLSDAANRFIGPAGAALIAAGALISILGNLNVGLLAGSRLLFAMSERREMPAIFSKIHNRSKAPHVAIVFTALLIFVFTIQLSFLTVLLTATVARLLVYATSCLSLIVFRRRGDVPEAQFSVPYGKAIAILSLILILWLITNTDLLKEGLPIIITVSTGLAYFYANRIYRVQPVI